MKEKRVSRTKAKTVGHIKAKTVKRSLILIAVLSLVGGTSVFTQQFQLQRLGRKELAKAEAAAKKGDVAEADKIFRQHLQIFPDDVEVQIQLADVLSKGPPSPIRKATVLQIYNAILKRDYLRHDVRRLQAKLKIDMQRFESNPGAENGADADLKILMKWFPNDGELFFLKGRCYEAGYEEGLAKKTAEPVKTAEAVEKALSEYRKAIEHLEQTSSQKIDASERLAMLLRDDRIGQPKEADKVEADKVMNSLVKAAPENYLVYLARGRYRLAVRDPSHKSLSDAKRDFKTAKEKAPAKPEAYLELAKVVGNEWKSKTEEAKQWRLQLMPSVKDVNGLPKAGKSLMIVAVVDQVLHFRGFDSDGKVVVDTDEKKLPEEAHGIEDLRKQLESLQPPHPIVTSEKDRVISTALSIVGYSQIRPILEEGEKNAPNTAEICLALANLERYANGADKAIEVLERGIKLATDKAQLHLLLTQLLIDRGDTDRLLAQIKQLNALGYNTQYSTARYHINAKEFLKARQLLQPILNFGQFPDLRSKATIYGLLALCQGHLGEPKLQHDALLKAVSADPKNITAQLAWIANMRSRGDTDGAIKEYRLLVDREPSVRLILAQLLIEQNQRRPESQRNWNEVKELIEQARKTFSGSVEPVILNVELLVAQGNLAEVQKQLAKARTEFPKSAEILRITEANIIASQGQFTDALAMIDRAQKELGDSVALRLASASLWASQKGPEAVENLVRLGEDVKEFTKPDRKRLLNELASQLVRQEKLEDARRLWTQLAKEDPKDIVLQLTLLDLAFKLKNKSEIEKNIEQITAIEGNEGLKGHFCHVRYLLWQAEQADEKATEEADQLKAPALRLEARAALSELMTRGGDQPFIFLALANLEEQELKQSSVKNEGRKAKEETILRYYIQAIELGEYRSEVVRRTVHLLFKNGRSGDAIALIAGVPVEAQLVSDAEREALARKAVAAKPDDFQERFWLVQILAASGRQEEAETELRKAVALAPNDPGRWVTLTSFLVFTAKQPHEAEKVIEEAKLKLPASLTRADALAKCCDILCRAYENGGTEAEVNKWYDAARKWYEQAEKDHPQDLSIKRNLTDLLLRTNHLSDVDGYLNAMMQGGNAETIAWATRKRALMYAAAQQLSEALALFEPNGKPARAGDEGKTRKDPDDLRIIARLLDREKTLVQRKRAIEILETLAEQNLASSEDRFRLAHLYDATGDWPKSRLKYRELDFTTRNPKDVEALNHRLFYLAQYIEGLLQHRKPDDKEDLGEAQQLLDDIKRHQPTPVMALILQVQIYRARNDIDPAVKLIRDIAYRRNATPQVVVTLADLAERMKQFELAEQLYRRRADLPNKIWGKLVLAEFLSRRGHTKDALAICEPLWTDDREVERTGDRDPEVEQIATTCIAILFGSETHTPDPEQVNRVASWFERAMAQPQLEKQRRPNPFLFIGLGNLREKQGDYQKAEELYRRAINENKRDGISLNNLAWLTALYDGNVEKALNYANDAIAIKSAQADFLDTRGVIHLKAGAPKLALDDLSKAVENDPSSPSKLFHLAQAQLANNEKEKARESLKMAKAKGLTVRSLHALEQKDYQELLNKLG